ncbi:hypothetical protein ACJRO7_021649 [Eucalyptus globulus]|uniref:SWIM-type domain-containing protein n=1 Tax=Eucalyptus globulus TaxID=34317 RepID=A0ABD3KX57_EUCGL
MKRTGCEACIKFKIENGVWIVDKFKDVHNHPFIDDKQKHLIRSYRHMTNTNKSILTSMAGAGIRPIKNIGFTLCDCQNFLQSKIRNLVNTGDCQTLLNHFNCLQLNGSNFSYTFQLDEEQRLTNFFWSDGVSKLDYESFGDVVVFDTTYRTNKYNMICAPFVMGNKAPKTIFTDQDHVMANAIKTVLPNTNHCLCVWHIGKNAMHHIGHFLGKSSFRDKYWYKLLYHCEFELEMEIFLKDMCQEWSLGDHKWLNGMYQLHTFSTIIISTQRSESTNNIFKNMTCKIMTLSEFVGHYEKQAEKIRNSEVVDDFEYTRGKSQIAIGNSRILKHAADDEFLHVLFMFICRSETNGPLQTYIVATENSERRHIVHFSSSDLTITCSCKLYEMRGWLCRHALCILANVENVRSIHSQYILKRMTKAAKQWVYCDVGQNSHIAVKSKTLRLKRLMQLSFNVMNISANHDVTEELATTTLLCLHSHITNKMQSLTGNDHINFLARNNKSEDVENNEIRILDPLRRRPKGIPNTRLKGSSEKRKRKVSSCIGGTSHKHKVYDTLTFVQD